MSSLYESGEMYLETILLLKEENDFVRSVDIADELDYSKPSVSRAINKLRENGYIIVEKDGNIVLTGMGEKTAKSIYERHRKLTQFLVLTLGVDEEMAAEDACRFEHVISNEIFEKVRDYVLENE